MTKHFTKVGHINFPRYRGVRCLMMPFVQGDPMSVPYDYASYRTILENVFLERGEIGYLTIDESPVNAGSPHRGNRAAHGRAIHTEAGKIAPILGWGAPSFVWGVPQTPSAPYGWGMPDLSWGGRHKATLDPETEVLLANSIDGTCALWDACHEDTSADGDIGDRADEYPYSDATIMAAGDVYKIGILTPHESLPVDSRRDRQFLRIVGRGVHGREDYFTENPLMGAVR